MSSVKTLEKELLRRLRDNSYSRSIITTRGKLDMQRVAHYRTSKRLYNQKSEQEGKKVNIHLIIDTSGSMNQHELYASWVAAKSVRRTFKDVAKTHVYFYNDIVKQTSDAVIDVIEKQGWDENSGRFQEEFIDSYIRADIGSNRIRYTLDGKEYDAYSMWMHPSSNRDSKRQTALRAILKPEMEAWKEAVARTGAVIHHDGTTATRGVGNNNEIIALDHVFKHCETRPEERHIVFLFTDGGFGSIDLETGSHPFLPWGVYLNGRRVPNLGVHEIGNFIKDRIRGKDIHVIPVGIGTNEPARTLGYGTCFSTSGDMAENFLKAVLEYTKKLPIFRR